jgi:hypothetical protein
MSQQADHEPIKLAKGLVWVFFGLLLFPIAFGASQYFVEQYRQTHAGNWPAIVVAESVDMAARLYMGTHGQLPNQLNDDFIRETDKWVGWLEEKHHCKHQPYKLTLHSIQNKQELTRVSQNIGSEVRFCVLGKDGRVQQYFVIAKLPDGKVMTLEGEDPALRNKGKLKNEP